MEPLILGFDRTVETSSFGFDGMDFDVGMEAIFDDEEVPASPSTPPREESAKLFRGHINGLPVHLLEHGPSVVEVTEEDYLALKVYRRRGPRTAATHSQITASMPPKTFVPQHFPLYDEALVRGKPGSVLSPRARSLRVLRWRTKRLGQKRGARKRKTGGAVPPPAKIAKTVMPVLVQMPMVSTKQMPLSPFTDQEASDEDVALRT